MARMAKARQRVRRWAPTTSLRPKSRLRRDAQLTRLITKGKGKMPAYGGKLKDTEIKDLVTYVRSLAK